MTCITIIIINLIKQNHRAISTTMSLMCLSNKFDLIEVNFHTRHEFSADFTSIILSNSEFFYNSKSIQAQSCDDFHPHYSLLSLVWLSLVTSFNHRNEKQLMQSFHAKFFAPCWLGTLGVNQLTWLTHLYFNNGSIRKLNCLFGCSTI